jgi:hypothetical protein
MRITYSYLSADMVSADELHAGLQFSLDLAASDSKELTIFVNSIAHCEQFMSKFFKSPELNKLRANQKIQLNGISVELESSQTIETYKTYSTALAVHASPDLLSKIDKNKSIRTLVLVAEERDISKEWLAAADAKKLAIRQ